MTTICIENFRAMGANATIAKFSLIRAFAEFLSAEDIQMEASTLRGNLLTNGIGYGVRRYALGDTDERWASVPDLSATGANLDFGLMFKRGHFLAGIGADLILPSGASHVSYLDLTISAGVSF